MNLTTSGDISRLFPRAQVDGFGFTFNEGYHILPEMGELKEVAVRKRNALNGIDVLRG